MIVFNLEQLHGALELLGVPLGFRAHVLLCMVRVGLLREIPTLRCGNRCGCVVEAVYGLPRDDGDLVTVQPGVSSLTIEERAHVRVDAMGLKASDREQFLAWSGWAAPCVAEA